MNSAKNIIGLDCGNSSFRVLLGRFDGKTIKTEVLDQTPNNMVHVGDYYYWDLLKIFDSFKATLKRIAKDIHIDSIGICTWGVDFALFDKAGTMISNSLSYRNVLGAKYLETLSDDEKKKLYFSTGIVSDKINSVYLLRSLQDAVPDVYSIADKLLMIPDVLNYFMTNIMQNEPSELSTTQLMDSKSKKIDEKACSFFGISEQLFSKIGEHGKIIGNVSQSILEEIEVDYDIPVVCVPSHDTASAVAAIPTDEEDFAFISSGTWSLIGTELDEPIINDDALSMNLTNEVGAFDKITLLKNSAGMFIIQKIKAEYDHETGQKSTWDELDELADSYTGEIPLFNINNERFFNPVNMSREIWNYLCETNQVSGTLNYAAIIKAVHESMACCYAVTISDLEKLTAKKYDSIYIVGGGSKNVMVNKLTARRTGKKVIACSKESTALGNIATQLKAFDDTIDLKKLRKIIAASVTTTVYEQPAQDLQIVDKYRSLK